MQAERWLYPEMSRLFMVAGIGFMSLSVLMGYLIARIRGGFKAFSKSTILYSIVLIVLFGLIGLSGALHLFASYGSYYVFFQALCLGLGILHLLFMQQWLKWTGPDAFWPELLHLIVLAVAGAVAIAMTFRIFDREGMEIPMATSALFFVLPFFVRETYRHALHIPPRIFRVWEYPQHAQEPLPDEKKMRNLLVISFEFQKKPGDRYFTNFRAKAPVDMDFGELFYYFINDYNDRHSESGIQFQKKTGSPDGWIFYKKPKWYQLFTKYIDSDKTVFINNIRENDVIICNRIA